MSEQKVKEGITLLSRQSAHSWFIAVALFYGFGLLVFHAKADFENVHWVNAYFLWQFAKDALMMMAICFINRSFVRLLGPMMIYSIIRLCLEIVAIFTGLEANNPLIVTILFLACLVACVYLSIIHTRERWRSN